MTWYRIIVPWDIGLLDTANNDLKVNDPRTTCSSAAFPSYQAQVERLRRWYATVAPLVTTGTPKARLMVSFEHDKCLSFKAEQKLGQAPDAVFGAAMDEFRKRYPLVKAYGAWNEPNLASRQPWRSPRSTPARRSADQAVAARATDDERTRNTTLAAVAGRIWLSDWDRCKKTPVDQMGRPAKDSDGVLIQPCVAVAGELGDAFLGSPSYIQNYRSGMGDHLDHGRHVPWSIHTYHTISHPDGREQIEQYPDGKTLRGTVGDTTALEIFLKAINRESPVWITEAGATDYLFGQAGGPGLSGDRERQIGWLPDPPQIRKDSQVETEQQFQACAADAVWRCYKSPAGVPEASFDDCRGRKKQDDRLDRADFKQCFYNHDNRRYKLYPSKARQLDGMNFILNQLRDFAAPGQAPRINRFFYYHWESDSSLDAAGNKTIIDGREDPFGTGLVERASAEPLPDPASYEPSGLTPLCLYVYRLSADKRSDRCR